MKDDSYPKYAAGSDMDRLNSTEFRTNRSVYIDPLEIKEHSTAYYIAKGEKHPKVIRARTIGALFFLAIVIAWYIYMY